MSTYNSHKAAIAQQEYQKRTGSPAFPPAWGTCWSCKRNIYEQHYWKFENHRKIPAANDDFDVETGISVELAGKELVTGCPHCNRSYCD